MMFSRLFYILIRWWEDSTTDRRYRAGASFGQQMRGWFER